MLGLFLALFGLTEVLGITFLPDPTGWMGRELGIVAAAAGVGLLIADVFIPVPSSLIMIAHGALFGIALGTALC